MKNSRELVKSVVLGVGAIGFVGGLAAGTIVAFEAAEHQLAVGLQQAAYPGVRPMMFSRATPMRETESTTGPTLSDYVVPGGFAVGELGIAGYVLWRFWPRASKQPADDAPDICRLTTQEAKAFEMIVSHFNKDS